MDQSPISIRGEPQAAPAGLDRVSLGPARAEAADSTDPAPLRIDDDDRYGRLRLISWWRQERLATASLLVVGAGARETR